MKVCPNCSKKRYQSSNFCYECGFDFSEAEKFVYSRSKTIVERALTNDKTKDLLQSGIGFLQKVLAEKSLDGEAEDAISKASYKTIHSFPAHQGSVASLVFHPNERFLISSGEDNTLKVWDSNKNVLIHTFIGYSRYALSPDGQYIAAIRTSANARNRLEVFETESWEKKFTKSFDVQQILDIGFSPDNQYVITKMKDQDIVDFVKFVAFAGNNDGNYNYSFWDLHNGTLAKKHKQLEPKLNLQSYGFSKGWKERVEQHKWMLEWYSEEGNIYSAQSNYGFKLLDASKKVLATFQQENFPVAFSKDNEMIATSLVFGRKTVSIRKLEPLQKLYSVQLDSDPTAISFIDKKRIAIGQANGTITFVQFNC